ncbi:unnamed protein product [Ectocarpus sp. CCAP 1310/34]|nr:unnamed protein product [Ectocarpus sp. CCAP 1310/34]
MPLSDASIGNLERLSKFVDAGYIKESSHKDFIKKHVMANKPIDDNGMVTAEDYREQLDAKVADLLRDGAPRSGAAGGEAGVGGSQVVETPRTAQKKGKRTAKEARAAANRMHANIVNSWAAATSKPVGWMEIPFASFGHIKRTRNGIVEEVTRVHYPIAPPPPKLKCLYCPKTFAFEQSRSLHCSAVHPAPLRHLGRGLRRALATGGTMKTPPWHGYSGRCFNVAFHHSEGGGHTTAAGRKMCHVRGSCSFELQPRTQGDGTSGLPDDGLLSDEERTKRKKTGGAEKRTQYSNRKKAAVVAELRELEADHAERLGMFTACSASSSWQGRPTFPNPTSASGTVTPRS